MVVYVFIYLPIFLFMISTVKLGEDEYAYHSRLSTLEECRRPCTNYEPPRHCYYHLAIEYFHTMGTPCFSCRQNGTDQLRNKPNCQCIEADGKKRTILSINRLLPGPSIQVCEFDTLIIDVENKAEGLEASLHWHGLFLEGYQYYDGVPMVTQCPIMAGSTFRYQFPVNNAGTFFYHAHVATQRMDGEFGSLIVRQRPNRDPNWHLYDEDLPTHIIMINDWFHYLSSERQPSIYTEVIKPPDNILINGRGRFQNPDGKVTNATLETFYVEPGKRYRFRLINAFSLRCTSMFTIENHELTIIAQDASSVYPKTVTSLNTGGGERVDFVLTANQKPGSYWIQVRGFNDCARKQNQQLAILSYRGASKTPRSSMPTYRNFLPEGNVYNPRDGKCDQSHPNNVCSDQLKGRELLNQRLIMGEPDVRFILPLDVHAFEFGEKNPFYSVNNFHKISPYPTYPFTATATVDGIVYVPPSELLITSHFGSEDMCNRRYVSTNHCPNPCYCTHVLDIDLGSVVEIILYDKAGLDPVFHPFHLHGYKFTVLKIGPERTQNITLRDVNSILREHQRVLHTSGYSPHLPMKDTIIVPTTGYVILRFIANNPGWWLFHCHIDSHMVEGMNMILHVGGPRHLPPIPPNFPMCGSWLPRY